MEPRPEISSDLRYAEPARAEVPTEPEHARLARILAAGPFGLDIVDRNGGKIFSSAMRSAEHLRARTFRVEVDGEPYSVSLSLDEQEQRQREEDLVRRAYFDDLTGLPNRALFETSVTELMAGEQGSFALAFIDIDGFKHINDYYGHAIGDRLLAKIAERLGSGLRRSDMLARLSGDEFVLLVSPVIGLPDLERDLAWMSERLKEPFFVEGYEISTSASIGVSLYPKDGASYEVLRGNADRAMYEGKTATKGTVRFFDGSIRHAADERSRMEQRLRLAIRDKRVCCAYQPKVELRSGKVAGVEVLMRWRDEDGVIQAPGGFVGLAVELGLIDDLTRFILSDTVASIDRINETFGPDTTISINIAARQAGDNRFMRSFVDELGATGLAGRFTLEITEEAFLSRSEFQSRILPMVREIGAKVSIDDFGVGFSSLSALADITADEIKIDRSFITDVHKRPRSQSILKAIEALAHSLGMTIVVEGVESFEELAYLQAVTRIQLGQGFYFARPTIFDEQGLGDPYGRSRSQQPARSFGAVRLAGGRR